MSASVVHPLVQKMIDNEGIWICGDAGHENARIVIWSMGGHLIVMRRDVELEPTRFLDTLTVVAGPIT